MQKNSQSSFTKEGGNWMFDYIFFSRIMRNVAQLNWAIRLFHNEDYTEQ